MATIVLVHGWGFDNHVWDAVRVALSAHHKVTATDFGFFGAVSPPPTFQEPVIAVGHSLGALWWLTQATPPWSRLLMINGFPRFTETDGFAPAVTPRVLERMRRKLGNDAATVLAEFRHACGASPTPCTGDAERLAAGLGWLADWDGREQLHQRRNDIWSLAASNDPIVPAAMSRAAFAALPAAQRVFTDAAGHVLPLSAPELCANWIERVASA